MNDDEGLHYNNDEAVHSEDDGVCQADDPAVSHLNDNESVYKDEVVYFLALISRNLRDPKSYSSGVSSSNTCMCTYMCGLLRRRNEDGTSWGR